MTDQVAFHCPHCNQRYQLKAPTRDTQYSCKKCKGAFVIEGQTFDVDQHEGLGDQTDEFSLPAEEDVVLAELSSTSPEPPALAGLEPASPSVKAPVCAFSPADLANAFDPAGRGTASSSTTATRPNGSVPQASTFPSPNAPVSQSLNELNLGERPKTSSKNYLPLIIIGILGAGFVATILAVSLWIYFRPSKSFVKGNPRMVPGRRMPGAGQRPLPMEQAPDVEQVPNFGDAPVVELQFDPDAGAVREQPEPEFEFRERPIEGARRRAEAERNKKEADQPKTIVANESLPNLEPNQIVAEFGELGWGVRSLSFSPRGMLYAGKNDNALLTFNVEQGQSIDEFKNVGKSGSVGWVIVSPDGKTMLSTERSGAIHVWDLGPDGGPKKRGTYEGHREQILSMRISQDGTRVASGTTRGDFRVWDLANLQDIANFRLERKRLHATYLSPDNQTAMTSNGETIFKFDLVANRMISQTKVTSGYAQAAAFSPDGKTLVVPYAYDLKVIDVDSGKLAKTLKGPKYSIFSVAFSPDGKYVVAGGGRVVQWDWESGELVNEYEVGPSSTVKAIAFSSDGKQMAVAHEPLSKAVRVFLVRNHAGEGAN